MKSKAAARNLALMTCLSLGQLLPFAAPAATANAAAAAAATPNACHAPALPDAPACPKTGSLLTDDYPAQAMTISDDEGGAAFVISTVEKVFRAQMKNPPLLFLNVHDETLMALRADLSKQSWATPKMLSNLRQVRATATGEMGEVSDYYLTWQQDVAIGSFNPKTGNTQARFVSEYPWTGDYVESLTKEMNACGVEVGVPTPNKDAHNAYSGGNLTTITPNICVLGASTISAKDWSSYAKQMCGDQTQILKAPSFWTQASHADEIFKSLKVPGPSCNLVLEFASPRKAIEVLKASPQESAFDFKRDQIMGLQSAGSARELRGLNAFCGIRQEHIRHPKEAARVPTRADETDIDSGEKIISPLSSGIMLFLDKHLDCEDVTNLDMATVVAADPQMREYNQLVQQQMDSFKADVLKAVTKSSPECHVAVIDVPQLFVGNIALKGSQHTLAKSVNDGTGFSLLPNPTNSVQIGQTLLMPEPHNSAFKTYLTQALNKVGLQVETIDTRAQHASGGDLHCATQVFRACRPQ